MPNTPTKQDYTPEERKDMLSNLIQALNYSTSGFDSLTITIGGGALALSLTFIGEIVPLKEAHFMWMFYTAVPLFITGLLLSFIGHWWGIKFFYKEGVNVWSDPAHRPAPNNTANTLNLIIAVSIVVGVAFLALFVTLNINDLRESKVEGINL